jgi:signal transduction histidine kinase
MQLNLSTKALTLIAIPLLMDLALIATLFFALQRADFESAQLNNSRSIVEKADRISRLVSDIILLSVRKKVGYGFNDGLAKIRRLEIEEVETALAEIEKLARKSPASDSYMKAYSTAKESIQKLKLDSEKTDSGSLLQAIQYFKELTPEYSSIMKLMADANELETKTVQAAVINETQMRINIRNLIIFGFMTNVALAVILTLVFNKGISQRLAYLMENASRLPTGQKFTRSLGGGDEIGQLDLVLRNAAADLAEARKKERFLIENMPVALASLRVDGTIELVNPEMETLFSCSEADLQNMRISDLLLIKSESDLVAGKPAELQLKNSESEKFVELVIKEFGNTRLAAMIDITERLAIQRLRRQFVAMVSHDLRTPLTSVQATLDMMLGGVFGEVSAAGRKQLDRAEVSVDRMILLINDLLDLEKLESGSFNLSPNMVEIDDVIERALEAASFRAEESDVKLSYERSSINCWADRDRIIQVLINLIDNAIKFSKPEQTVSIVAKVVNVYVEVQVKDHGRGIPDEMREQIFERFVQVSGEDRKKRHGTGLGLAICKAIVLGHGGDIGVDSKPGEGSTFWFRLPLEEPIDGENSSS